MSKLKTKIIGSVGALLVAGALALASAGLQPDSGGQAESPDAPAINAPQASAVAEEGPAVIVDDPDMFAVAAEVAGELPTIDPAASTPDYKRDSFGEPWADVDGNGCRTRDDILARDLFDVTVDEDGCTVLTGTLEWDPYTGETIDFQHDRVATGGNPGSAAIQGEHIIALKAAHDGGAWRWSDEQRLAFANDPNNLLAVDGPANSSKGEKGPAGWLVPENPAYVCTYSLRYAELVDTYQLAIDAADRDVLAQTLASCATND